MKHFFFLYAAAFLCLSGYGLAQERRTLLMLGQTGVGKSLLGSTYLHDPTAFASGDSPESVTMFAVAKEKLIDDVLRVVIDTQGLDDTQGLNEAHVQQMVKYLKEYQHGVNGIVIVINGQADRFDEGTQILIRFVNNFFNNTDFWNHVGIVFTKVYRQVPFNKEIKRTQYVEMMRKIVSEVTKGVSPRFPVFFVDSPSYNEDPQTRSDIAALHAWLYNLPAMPTDPLTAAHTKIANVTIENEIVEVSKIEIPIMGTKEDVQTLAVGMRMFILFGPRDKVTIRNTREYQKGKKIIITYKERVREVQTHYDKTVTYGDWNVIRTWEEEKEILY